MQCGPVLLHCLAFPEHEHEETVREYCERLLTMDVHERVVLEAPETRRYLNRLSLLLFVLGRYEEDRAGQKARPAKPS